MFLQPFFLKLQVSRQFVIGIGIGFLGGPFLVLFNLICFFLNGIEVRTEIKVLRHAKELEGVLSDLIFYL
jgi:hypothetical protein